MTRMGKPGGLQSGSATEGGLCPKIAELALGDARGTLLKSSDGTKFVLAFALVWGA